jgi:hypothetical protein
VQVLGDLRAGLSGADDQHLTVGQLGRVAVLVRVDLRDRGRQLLGHARDDRGVVAAGRDDDLARGVVALRGLDREEAVLAPRDARDRDALMDRRVHLGDEGREVGDDLVLLHEPVRVRPVIRVARQVALPVRRDEAEAVPALRRPAVRGGPLLEHAMLDPALLEVVAHRQAGLAASHDDDRDVTGRGGHGANSVTIWA